MPYILRMSLELEVSEKKLVKYSEILNKIAIENMNEIISGDFEFTEYKKKSSTG